MPDLTTRLGIKKPLGNENVTRASFNENWDIIDANATSKAFSYVNVGGATIAADSNEDTLQIIAGAGIAITADISGDAFTISTNSAPNWTNLTLQNGATVSASKTPRYTKTGNQVKFEGQIAYTSYNTVIATLPAGYRPIHDMPFICAMDAQGATNGQFAIVNVQPNGQIVLYADKGTAGISLNQIEFFAEL